jgi:hypothetical protein
MTQEKMKLVTFAIDIALGAYLLWMVLPASVKLPVTLAISGEWDKVQRIKKRRGVVRQMEFEMFMATEALTEYDRHHDADQLARDLAA